MPGKPSYQELEEKVRVLEQRTCDYREVKADLVKLSHAVEQSPAAIMITDPQGVIEYVNPTFSRMSGYATAEALGMNASQLGEQSQGEQEQMWNVIRSGRVWRGEFRNRKKTGEHYWERASISAIRDANEVITHYMKISEDVTDLKKAQEALEESERRRNRDQKRMAILKFANEVALRLMDELRNPLVAIGGFAKRIVQKEDCSEKLQEYAGIIFEQSQKLDAALNRALAHLRGASRDEGW